MATLDKIPALTFTQFQALPEQGKAGFYTGVLVIEKGPAKGHYAVKDGTRVVNYDSSNTDHEGLQKYPIHIGDETLNDVVRAASATDSTKCKLDHGSTVRDIVGDYSAFRLDGDKVRADLSLMESTPHRAYVEELITKMSDKIGNSIDFDYAYEISGDIAIARVVKLNSVDIVDTPAATNSLFNEQSEKDQYMPLTTQDIEAIGSLVESKINQRFSTLETSINTRFDEVKQSLAEGDDKEDKKDDEEKKEDKGEMSDKYEEGDDKKDKKDDDADDEKLSAKIQKAVFTAIQKAMPKAAVQNLTAGNQVNANQDTFEAKFAACKASGLSDAQAIRNIAVKFPKLYNAKFGAGSASTKL